MMDDNKKTFIQEARRKQIIKTSVERIATQGYGNTSLDDIAKSAGISKSVIAYHFKHKDNLIRQTANSLLEELSEYVRKEIDLYDSAADKMRVYIKSNFKFLIINRNNFLVSLDIGLNIKPWEDQNLFSLITYVGCQKRIQNILKYGLKTGEFREDIDLDAIASIVQGAIDGISLQWIFAEELVSIDKCQDNLICMLEGIILREQ
jgi:TetR/AcrR family transcriptional regulator, fatty acid metabolism regulator protein